MRQVLVTQGGWLDYAPRFAADGIEFVHRQQAHPDAKVDAVILRAREWQRGAEFAAPVLVHGTLQELSSLQDEPIGYLLETDVLAKAGSEAVVIEILQTLWREGRGGQALYLEDAMKRANLSARECEVMRWRMQGKSREEAGAAMKITDSTARTMSTSAFLKLGVKNMNELQARVSEKSLPHRNSVLRQSSTKMPVAAPVEDLDAKRKDKHKR